MPGDTLIKPSIRKDAERSGEVLLAVETLVLEVVEDRVAADLEGLARLCLAQDLDLRGIIGATARAWACVRCGLAGLFCRCGQGGLLDVG
jgi:hypothetical protein